MIKNLSPKDKKALTAGGICLLVYVIFVFGIQPFYLKQKSKEEQIENKILFIKKNYEILNQKDYYEQKDKANKAAQSALSRRFLEQTKPALAAASLQKILEGYAQQTSVTIESVRIEKPKYIEHIQAVPVEINIRSKLANLTQFVYLIENHEKFILVEEVVTRRVNKKDPEELQTRVLVSGFIQQLEENTAKKI